MDSQQLTSLANAASVVSTVSQQAHENKQAISEIASGLSNVGAALQQVVTQDFSEKEKDIPFEKEEEIDCKLMSEKLRKWKNTDLKEVIERGKLACRRSKPLIIKSLPYVGASAAVIGIMWATYYFLKNRKNKQDTVDEALHYDKFILQNFSQAASIMSIFQDLTIGMKGVTTCLMFLTAFSCATPGTSPFPLYNTVHSLLRSASDMCQKNWNRASDITDEEIKEYRKTPRQCYHSVLSFMTEEGEILEENINVPPVEFASARVYHQSRHTVRMENICEFCNTMQNFLNTKADCFFLTKTMKKFLPTEIINLLTHNLTVPAIALGIYIIYKLVIFLDSCKFENESGRVKFFSDKKIQLLRNRSRGRDLSHSDYDALIDMVTKTRDDEIRFDAFEEILNKRNPVEPGDYLIEPSVSSSDIGHSGRMFVNVKTGKKIAWADVVDESNERKLVEPQKKVDLTPVVLPEQQKSSVLTVLPQIEPDKKKFSQRVQTPRECKWCQQKFKKKEFFIHINKCEKRTIICPLCRKKGFSRTEFAEHDCQYKTKEQKVREQVNKLQTPPVSPPRNPIKQSFSRPLLTDFFAESATVNLVTPLRDMWVLQRQINDHQSVVGNAWVYAGHLITASHVISTFKDDKSSEDKPIKVFKISNGKKDFVEALSVDDFETRSKGNFDHDIAFTYRGNFGPSMPIKDEAKTPSNCSLLGVKDIQSVFPDFRTGEFCNNSRNELEKTYRHLIPTEAGLSGSPIYQGDHVIAMHVAGGGPAANTNYCIAVKDIRSYVATRKN